MISCTFERDDKDIAAGFHYFFSSTAYASKLRKKLIFHNCINAIVYSVFVWFVISYIDPTRQYFSLILSVCFGIAIFPVISWQNSPKGMADKSTNAAMMIVQEYPIEPGACTVTISDEGITFSDPNTEQHYSWTAVHEMDMTDEYMIFIFAGGAMSAIPKAKVDTGVMQQMHQLAVEKIHKETAS